MEPVSKKGGAKVCLSTMPAILSIIIVVGFFFVIFWLMIFPINDSSKSLIDILIGFLGGGFGQVLAFYVGTTHGSQEKTRLLADSKNNNDAS